jgi:hypothetical protein
MVIMEHLVRHFERMGARVAVLALKPRARRSRRERWRHPRPRLSLDVRNDRRGEYFEIRVPDDEADLALEVVDVRPGERHLLLMARRADRKDKYLCGHDERHWFVAAVPGPSVSTVATAMEALKPAAVRASENRKRLRRKNRQRRRNAAFIRQGEWFFIPADGVDVSDELILRDEPLQRGGGKPHMVDEVFRRGGVTVYVCRHRPNGLTEAAYRELLERNPRARFWGWQVMRRDMEVYARGRVRHADHKTVVLAGWHLVQVNTETKAPAMRHVAFLD